MSRSFNGTTQYLSGSAVLTTTPLTMACWFYSTSDSVDQVLMSLGRTGTAIHQHTLRASGATVGDPVRAVSQESASAGVAVSTTGYTANTWQHACGVFVSATDRRAYVNGGSEGTNATNRNPTSMDGTYIGTRQTTALDLFVVGRIAEAAIWNIALSVSEIAALARGVSPFRIRPGNLKAYWPLYGVGSPEPDYIGGFHLTLNASPTQADHVPVMPSFAYAQGWAGAFTAEVAGGQPMQLRGTTVPRLRQWQPRGLRG